MAEQYTHLRVRTRTRDRLKAAIERLVKAVERGQCADPGVNPDNNNPNALGLSVDVFLNLLLDARESHQARGKKSRKPKATQEVQGTR